MVAYSDGQTGKFPKFDADAFITYAHLDDRHWLEGKKGWVTHLHNALKVRVGMERGTEPNIWMDPELKGNDDFAETILLKLRRVAALVPVVSPGFIHSDWTNRELEEFVKATEDQSRRSRNRTRIFKVLKKPVPLESQPQPLRDLLGYEFFTKDPKTGQYRELDPDGGHDSQVGFQTKIDDIAKDMCRLLEDLAHPENADREVVFLAETTQDLAEQRDAIKRVLQERGYDVLPNRLLPLVGSELKAAVCRDLEQCLMSIHLVGAKYSFVPEGTTESLLEVQNELAIERGQAGGFARLLWIPPGLAIEDGRQRKVIERFRMDSRLQLGADLLETSFEGFKTEVENWLKRTQKTDRKPDPQKLARLYLIYDQRDADMIGPWDDFLFEQGFEVLRPLFDGDAAEIRTYHEDCLRECDGALIFHGVANELWLCQKQKDIRKSVAYGRTKPPSVAICMLPPKTLGKERFRTHEALVIPQFDGLSSDLLRPFISLLQD